MRKKILAGLLFLLSLSESGLAQDLNLPPRSGNALNPADFVNLASLFPPPPDLRVNNLIYYQIATGNVPEWMRRMVVVTNSAVIRDIKHTVSFRVTPDYLCLGEGEDYLLLPMVPFLAQSLANTMGCTLPTRKMVNTIWAQAAVKMTPEPIPPGLFMATIPVYNQHNKLVWEQRRKSLAAHPLGSLVAGDKKDVIISNLIYNDLRGDFSPVVIYGWQKTNGVPIQPSYSGHDQNWADYSHGIRFVQRNIQVDGEDTTVAAVLGDPNLAALLSDETNFPGNVIPQPYYPIPAHQ